MAQTGPIDPKKITALLTPADHAAFIDRHATKGGYRIEGFVIPEVSDERVFPIHHVRTTRKDDGTVRVEWEMEDGTPVSLESEEPMAEQAIAALEAQPMMRVVLPRDFSTDAER